VVYSGFRPHGTDTVITTRHAAMTFASALLMSGCGLKAALVLPPRAAPQPAPHSSPATPAGAPEQPLPDTARCPGDRAGSGDEPECAAKPASP